jgi:hypothetical protein
MEGGPEDSVYPKRNPRPARRFGLALAAFLSSGDMVISNEEARNEATLLLFKWRRKQG